MPTVLIVDDEKNIRSTVGQTFMLEGFSVLEAENGRIALELLGKGGIDLVLCDLQMPEVDGGEVLAAMRGAGDDTPLIFLTAHGSIDRAVRAVRDGAFDFIEKPPHADRILLAARNALRQASLVAENRELREDDESASDDMIGDAPPMRLLAEQIERTAPTNARVLILGENGTGKELIARALHRRSVRRDGPFVRVNCAAIPRELFESELFGHEKGAFTGATSKRRGKMVRASGGTLFLDEVGEIPLELQAKLLRAIEAGEVEPVGSEREVEVDVRILAATNRDLADEVRDGRFRQDLYYRLQVVTLVAPPLRERRDDLPALFDHFLQRACREHHLQPKVVDASAYDALARHDFPGNVRELRNLAERLLILAPGPQIDAAAVAAALPGEGSATSGAVTLKDNLRDTLIDVERQLIVDAIERNRGQMAATARELGLERSHLYKKLKALGIDRSAEE